MEVGKEMMENLVMENLEFTSLYVKLL